MHLVLICWLVCALLIWACCLRDWYYIIIVLGFKEIVLCCMLLCDWVFGVEDIEKIATWFCWRFETWIVVGTNLLCLLHKTFSFLHEVGDVFVFCYSDRFSFHSLYEVVFLVLVFIIILWYLHGSSNCWGQTTHTHFIVFFILFYWKHAKHNICMKYTVLPKNIITYIINSTPIYKYKINLNL